MKQIKQWLLAEPSAFENFMFGVILGYALFCGLGALVMYSVQ